MPQLPHAHAIPPIERAITSVPPVYYPLQAIVQLGMDLDSLEKRLQDASRARETRLRKAGLPGRVQMAIQLKGLDADVLALSRLLAVRTLQLEMEHIYRSLEDEALDMNAYDSGVGDEGVWRGLHLNLFLGLDGWSAMGCRLSSDAALLTYREGYISLL